MHFSARRLAQAAMKSMWWLESSSFSNSTGHVFTLNLTSSRHTHCWREELGGSSLASWAITTAVLVASIVNGTNNTHSGRAARRAGTSSASPRYTSERSVVHTRSRVGGPLPRVPRECPVMRREGWRRTERSRHGGNSSQSDRAFAPTVSFHSIAVGYNLFPLQNLFPFSST